MSPGTFWWFETVKDMAKMCCDHCIHCGCRSLWWHKWCLSVLNICLWLCIMNDYFEIYFNFIQDQTDTAMCKYLITVYFHWDHISRFFLLQILRLNCQDALFRHHAFFWGSKWFKTVHMPHSLSQLQRDLVLMKLHASVSHNDIAKKIECSLIAIRKMSCNLRYYDSLLVPRVKKKDRFLALTSEMIEIYYFSFSYSTWNSTLISRL